MAAQVLFLIGCAIMAIIPVAVVAMSVFGKDQRRLPLAVAVGAAVLCVTGLHGFAHVVSLTPDQFVVEFNAARRH
jgi:hypothetical protein